MIRPVSRSSSSRRTPTTASSRSARRWPRWAARGAPRRAAHRAWRSIPSRRADGGWDRRAGFPTEGEAARARRDEDRARAPNLGVLRAWLPFGSLDFERHGDDEAVWAAVATPRWTPTSCSYRARRSRIPTTRGSALVVDALPATPSASTRSSRTRSRGGGAVRARRRRRPRPHREVARDAAYRSQLPLLGMRRSLRRGPLSPRPGRRADRLARQVAALGSAGDEARDDAARPRRGRHRRRADRVPPRAPASTSWSRPTTARRTGRPRSSSATRARASASHPRAGRRPPPERVGDADGAARCDRASAPTGSSTPTPTSSGGRAAATSRTCSRRPERFGVVRGAWRNFVPRPDDDRVLRRADDRSAVPPVVPPASAQHPLQVRSSRRRRRARRTRQPRGVRRRARGLRGWYPIEILHFPVRSLEHCLRKYVTQFVALERNAEKGIPGHMADAYRPTARATSTASTRRSSSTTRARARARDRETMRSTRGCATGCALGFGEARLATRPRPERRRRESARSPASTPRSRRRTSAWRSARTRLERRRARTRRSRPSRRVGGRRRDAPGSGCSRSSRRGAPRSCSSPSPSPSSGSRRSAGRWRRAATRGTTSRTTSSSSTRRSAALRAPGLPHAADADRRRAPARPRRDLAPRARVRAPVRDLDRRVERDRAHLRPHPCALQRGLCSSSIRPTRRCTTRPRATRSSRPGSPLWALAPRARCDRPSTGLRRRRRRDRGARPDPAGEPDPAAARARRRRSSPTSPGGGGSRSSGCASRRASLPLAAWALHNGVRYDDTTVARGGRAWVPFLRSSRRNGRSRRRTARRPRRLAALIEQEVPRADPHARLDVTLDAYLAERLELRDRAPDRALRHACSGAVRTTTCSSTRRSRRSASTRNLLPRRRGHLLGLPRAEAAPRGRRAARADRAGAAGARRSSRDGDVLPNPQATVLVDGVPYGFVWCASDYIDSCTLADPEAVGRPGRAARYREIVAQVRAWDASSPRGRARTPCPEILNRITPRYPTPVLWLAVGVVALVRRRPRGWRTIVLLWVAAFLVLLIHAASQGVAPEFALPVYPVFIVTALAAIARRDRRGPGRRLRCAPPALTLGPPSSREVDHVECAPASDRPDGRTHVRTSREPRRARRRARARWPKAVAVQPRVQVARREARRRRARSKSSSTARSRRRSENVGLQQGCGGPRRRALRSRDHLARHCATSQHAASPRGRDVEERFNAFGLCARRGGPRHIGTPTAAWPHGCPRHETSKPVVARGRRRPRRA